MAGTADVFSCLLVHLGLYSDRPVHRGRLRRRARVGTGCGVLRAWLVTTLPGGVRQHRPSATTSGTCECTNARPAGTAHVQRPKVWPRRARSQQSPRWSAERRASYVTGRKAPRRSAFTRVFYVLCACGRTSLARLTGAAAPERLSALRSPHFVWGRLANLGERYASREG